MVALGASRILVFYPTNPVDPINPHIENPEQIRDRILEAAGHKIPTEGLQWRGQIMRAMEEAGIAMGEDGALRVRQPEEKNWQAAAGPLVKDILLAARQAI